MEILKKSGIVLLLIMMGLGLFAQNNYNNLIAAFSESYSYEAAGNYQQAIASMKKVYDEKSYEINLRLGWLHYLSGLFTESTAYYQKAIALMPYAIEPRLGYVYPAAALGNWQQIKGQYDEILKIDPQNVLVNYRVGLYYYGLQDFKNAFKYFEKVVNLYPFDYDGVIMLAWTNYKLGKLREAKVLFYKALLLRPTDSSAQEGLSLIK